MSTVDLNVVADALSRWNRQNDPYFAICSRFDGDDYAIRAPYVPIVAAVLAAVEPLIEAQVREQIAAEAISARVCGLAIIDQEIQDDRPELYAGMFAVEVTLPVELTSDIRIGDVLTVTLARSSDSAS